MTSSIHQPQDKLFKECMKDLRVAREFFETHLPKDILERINLETLEYQSGQFIDELFKLSESDCIYKIYCRPPFAKNSIYLLCEHQSQIDKNMAFRFLGYKLRLWERLKKRLELPLSPIYTIVLYTGIKKWDASKDFFDLFGAQKNFAKQLFEDSYQIISVNEREDTEIAKRLWSGLLEFSLKHRKAKSFDRFLTQFLPWLKKLEIKNGVDFARLNLKFILEQIESVNIDSFIEKACFLLDSPLQEEIMTFADTCREEGRKWGRQEGRHEGLHEGRHEKMQEVALRLIQRRFSLPEIHEITGLSLEKIHALREQISLSP